jgi:hypothetical protein
MLIVGSGDDDHVALPVVVVAFVRSAVTEISVRYCGIRYALLLMPCGVLMICWKLL